MLARLKLSLCLEVPTLLPKGSSSPTAEMKIAAANAKIIRDAKARSASALTAFANISVSVLRSAGIPVESRVLLGISLVACRLTFHVHVWSEFRCAAWKALNPVYIRLWRNIWENLVLVEVNRQTAKSGEIHQFHQLIVLFGKKRFLYFARLASPGLVSLRALVQTRSPNGVVMPLVKIIVSDIAVLVSALPRSFGHMTIKLAKPDIVWDLVVRF